MLSIMPNKSTPLYPTSTKALVALGKRLKDARLRRHFSAETVCARANISRPTLTKIEGGDPSVTMGNYFQVLAVLGLEKDMATVALDDVLGRRLQDAELPHRERAPRRLSLPVKKKMPSGLGDECKDSPVEDKD